MTALSALPSLTPPVLDSMNSQRLTPNSVSYTPGRSTMPLIEKSIVPVLFPVPSAA